MLLNFFLFFAAGFSLKIFDNILDNKVKINKAALYLIALVPGVIAGYLLGAGVASATMVAAILAGTLLSRKIDNKIYAISFLPIIPIAFFLGIKEIFWPAFVLFVLAAAVDEIIEERIAKKYGKAKRPLIKWLLEKRPVLEITALAVSITLNNFTYFFAILAFDVGMHLAGRLYLLRSSQ